MILDWLFGADASLLEVVRLVGLWGLALMGYGAWAGGRDLSHAICRYFGWPETMAWRVRI